VGDRANGKIYKFSPTTYTEGSESQRVLIQTPRLDHGAPSVQKRSERLLITVKKTKPFDGPAKLLIGYRDNGNTSWTPPRVLDLPASGENEFLLRTERLGAYYSRQWRFYMSDDYPLCIVSIEEDVDI